MKIFRNLITGNNFESEIKGKGRAEFYVYDDNGKRAKIMLLEVFFVPNNRKNLIPLRKLKNSVVKVEFGDNNLILNCSGKVFPLRENNLFLLSGGLQVYCS